MTTRYKTPGEREGVKRRVQAFADRQRELGRQARKIWATDAEADMLRKILEAWRGEGSALGRDMAAAVELLKPADKPPSEPRDS